jgi:uncharacterized repeat protein (TIGR03803 family)
MIMDAAGNLYGTTAASFEVSQGRVGGTVFELQRNGEEWTKTTLHTFGHGADGAVPSGPLVFDKAGNLYGVTAVGGNAGGGTVFELKNTGNGRKEDILFNFAAPAGGYEPNGGLIFDSAGNLYGTTYYGGINVGQGCGTAFELTPTNGGAWNETVLYKFLCDAYGRANPQAGLVFDSAGNLYGTTSAGGSTSSGTAFELKRSANGAWTYFIIYTFQGPPSDGYGSNSGLLFDSKGNLYGTTGAGGTGGGGTVFEITP